MKRILFLIQSLALFPSLVACGGVRNASASCQQFSGGGGKERILTSRGDLLYESGEIMIDAGIGC